MIACYRDYFKPTCYGCWRSGLVVYGVRTLTKFLYTVRLAGPVTARGYIYHLGIGFTEFTYDINIVDTGGISKHRLSPCNAYSLTSLVTGFRFQFFVNRPMAFTNYLPFYSCTCVKPPRPTQPGHPSIGRRNGLSHC